MSPDPQEENAGIGDHFAEQKDAVDRAGISVLCGLQPLQPTQQLIRALVAMGRSA
jgi:hypothetical protein